MERTATHDCHLTREALALAAMHREAADAWVIEL